MSHASYFPKARRVTAPPGSTPWVAQMKGRRRAYKRWADMALTVGAYEARMEHVHKLDELLDAEGTAA